MLTIGLNLNLQKKLECLCKITSILIYTRKETRLGQVTKTKLQFERIENNVLKADINRKEIVVVKMFSCLYVFCC